jgi:hypothetical protein
VPAPSPARSPVDDVAFSERLIPPPPPSRRSYGGWDGHAHRQRGGMARGQRPRQHHEPGNPRVGHAIVREPASAKLSHRARRSHQQRSPGLRHPPTRRLRITRHGTFPGLCAHAGSGRRPRRATQRQPISVGGGCEVPVMMPPPDWTTRGLALLRCCGGCVSACIRPRLVSLRGIERGRRRRGGRGRGSVGRRCSRRGRGAGSARTRVRRR